MRSPVAAAVLAFALTGCSSESCPATYADFDGDGFGDRGRRDLSCAPPADYVANGLDCNDGEARANPDATEICDAVDNDCDGEVDEDVLRTFWPDADGDGFGAPGGDFEGGVSVEGCDVPPGYIEATDDCDDRDPLVFPGAVERCDGVDQDCDDIIDLEAVDRVVFYEDGDRDGYGNPDSASGLLCTAPAGYVPNAGDCDDTVFEMHPGANEVCDGQDNDCDGWLDDADTDIRLSGPAGYRDWDGDGWGDLLLPAYTCALPDGYVLEPGDCQDNDPGIHPEAPEVCGAGDEDCDGMVDMDDPSVDPGTLITVFRDADGDGHGDPLVAQTICTPDAGWVENATDCDDTDPTLGSEQRWRLDVDRDGYGAGPEVPLPFCSSPGSGYVPLAGPEDCDETDPAVHPNADEVCADGVDQDCSGADHMCHTAPLGDVLLTDALPLSGPQTGDRAGAALTAGDLDGDGMVDLVVGAPWADGLATNTGAAYIETGPFVSELRMGKAALRGEAYSDELGTAVALSPDVTADGRPDLWLGAPYHDAGGSDAGAVLLVDEVTLGIQDVWGARAKLVGAQPGDQLGVALATLRDADGDDAPDLVVGAPGAGSGGVAYVVPGAQYGLNSVLDAAAGLLGAPDEGAGSAVARAGDVDGDGLSDVIVGAPDRFGGAAYVCLGPLWGTVALSTCRLALGGETDGDGAGTSVAGGGDVDGDGTPDLVVGAPAAASGGAAYLVDGGRVGDRSLGASDAVLYGGAAADRAGTSVAMLGDLDADGFADIAVGAPQRGQGEGAAYVLYGPLAGALNLEDAPGLMTGQGTDQAGMGVYGVGDLDADGRDDLAVYGPAGAGTVWLLFGSD